MAEKTMSADLVIDIVAELDCSPRAESMVRIYAMEKSRALAIQVAKDHGFWEAEQMAWGKSAYRKCDSVSEAVRLAAEVYRDLKNVEPGVQLTAVH